MPIRRPHAIVSAEGHLVDSQLLKSIFDRVIDRGGDFEVQHFELGRTNDDYSKLTLKVSADDAATVARLVEDLLDGCLPERLPQCGRQHMSLGNDGLALK